MVTGGMGGIIHASSRIALLRHGSERSTSHLEVRRMLLLQHTLIAEVDFCIGEVRLIFQPVTKLRNSYIPSIPYLTYAQRFDVLPQDTLYTACRLPRLRRSFRSVGGNTRIMRGSVVAVERILGAVDIIPYFGRAADHRLTMFNSMALSDSYILNIYSDKTTYHMFSL